MAACNKYICQKKVKASIYLCWYSEDVHRTKCKALRIPRLTHSLCATKITRIGCYTTKYYNCIPRTIGAYIKVSTLVVFEGLDMHCAWSQRGPRCRTCTVHGVSVGHAAGCEQAAESGSCWHILQRPSDSLCSSSSSLSRGWATSSALYLERSNRFHTTER